MHEQSIDFFLSSQLYGSIDSLVAQLFGKGRCVCHGYENFRVLLLICRLQQDFGAHEQVQLRYSEYRWCYLPACRQLAR